MNHSHRLIINTAASYVRIVVHAITGVISTRIALNALGVSDYGLYNLIAGIVSMMSFLTGSLSISSQRFFSIAIGEDNLDKLNKHFNSSLGLHIYVSLLTILVLAMLESLCFNHIFNIEPDQLQVGKVVYRLMLISTAATIISIPYSAIMTAREDFVALSIFTIVGYFFQFFAAVILFYIDNNLLITYTAITVLGVVVQSLLCYGWSRIKYIETKLNLHDVFKFSLMRNMLGFVGWNTLGSMAMLVRNQGVAVVLNSFFGTVVNAAYGVANQVNSLVLSFATTITSVFTPSIIQAYGASNLERVKRVSIFSSKISFFLSGFMALPILLLLGDILSLWIGDVPEYTRKFSEYIIYSFLIQQLYPGINRAIYATGNIKGYQIRFFVLSILIIPAGYLLFNMGFEPNSIIVIMFFAQIGTLIVTMYYADKLCDISWVSFGRESVFKPVVIFCIVYFISILICKHYESLLIRIGVVTVSLLIFTLIYYKIALDEKEKSMLLSLIPNKFKYE